MLSTILYDFGRRALRSFKGRDPHTARARSLTPCVPGKCVGCRAARRGVGAVVEELGGTKHRRIMGDAGQPWTKAADIWSGMASAFDLCQVVPVFEFWWCAWYGPEIGLFKQRMGEFMAMSWMPF